MLIPRLRTVLTAAYSLHQHWYPSEGSGMDTAEGKRHTGKVAAQMVVFEP